MYTDARNASLSGDPAAFRVVWPERTLAFLVQALWSFWHPAWIRVHVALQHRRDLSSLWSRLETCLQASSRGAGLWGGCRRSTSKPLGKSHSVPGSPGRWPSAHYSSRAIRGKRCLWVSTSGPPTRVSVYALRCNTRRTSSCGPSTPVAKLNGHRQQHSSTDRLGTFPRVAALCAR